MAQDGTILNWLYEAYGMEAAIAGVLEAQVPLAGSRPALQAKLREHIATTRRQIERVGHRIDQLGGVRPSFAASAISSVGVAQGLLTGLLPFPLIRNTVIDYATEHLEIATYRALRTAAEAVGDAETIRLCDETLPEEEEMGRWLAEHLPALVRDTLGERGTTQAR